jgi:divalent metal cation (Fe/Co/Zn/Cd) transporter
LSQKMTLEEAHDIATRIEISIKTKLDIETTIHIDPVVT